VKIPTLRNKVETIKLQDLFLINNSSAELDQSATSNYYFFLQLSSVC